MARKLTVEKRFAEEGVVFYKEGPIKFLDVRLSYPHLDKPQKFARDDGTEVEKYGLEGLIESDRWPNARKYLVEKIKALMEAKNCKCPKANWFVLEGDPDERPELDGVYRIKCSESRKPEILDENGDTVDSNEVIRTIFYPGCRVDILIEMWGQNYVDKKTNVTSKRVNSSLRTVKWRRNDGRFGEEPIDTESAWDDEDEEGFEKEDSSALAKTSNKAVGGGKSNKSNDDEDDDL